MASAIMGLLVWNANGPFIALTNIGCCRVPTLT